MKKKIIIVENATAITYKMSLLMQLSSIITQEIPLKKQCLLKQILPLLRKEIILGKLSHIWITNNNDNCITLYNDRYIQININTNKGKMLLTHIIGFIIEKPNFIEHPFFFYYKDGKYKCSKNSFTL